jgi:hypothetical protein
MEMTMMTLTDTMSCEGLVGFGNGHDIFVPAL